MMPVQQKAVAQMLRPFTLHAQDVIANARASAERVPAVLALVQRALDHAGLKETVGMRAAPGSGSTAAKLAK
jgi:hypothetical protein